MSDGNFFTVDVDALSTAIGQVSTNRDTVNGGISALRGTIAQIEQIWQGPAAGSFTTLVENFNSVSDKLTGLLDDAIGRMSSTRDTYAQTEDSNTHNWSNNPGGSDPDQNQNSGSDNPPAQMLTARTPPTTPAVSQATAQPDLARPTARS